MDKQPDGTTGSPNPFQTTNGQAPLNPGAATPPPDPNLAASAGSAPFGSNPAAASTSPFATNPTTPATPAAPFAPAPGAAPVAGTPPINPANPANPANPSQKKSKKGLIIGLCCGAGALVAIIVAVVAVILLNRTDPVTAAINKLFSAEGVRNAIQFSGDIGPITTDNGPNGEPMDCNVQLNTSLNISPFSGTVEGGLDCVADDTSDYLNLQLGVIYPGDTSLYLRISGLVDFAKSQGIYPTTDSDLSDDSDLDADTQLLPGTDSTTVTDDPAEPGDSTAASLALIDALDGQWLEVPITQSGVSSAIDLDSLFSEYADCLDPFTGAIRSQDNGLASLYSANPFVTATTDNVTLVKKAHTVYRISIDSAKYNAFYDSFLNLPAFSTFRTCMQDNHPASYNDTSSSTVTDPSSNFTEIYVEVDDDHNFTRIAGTALSTQNGSEQKKIPFDLDFTYPDTVSAAAPTDAVTPEELVEQVLRDQLLKYGLSEDYLNDFDSDFSGDLGGSLDDLNGGLSDGLDGFSGGLGDINYDELLASPTDEY